MCGFIQRITDSPDVMRYLKKSGLHKPYRFLSTNLPQAMSLTLSRLAKCLNDKITNLIVSGDSTIDATWFDETNGNTLQVIEQH